MSTSFKHALSFDSDPYSVTNFVDRMHGECTQLQWLRELVVNSIEAIAATGEGGNILVHSIEQDMGEGIGNVRKLAVTDTGEGIAENELYSSFQVAMTSRGKGNYGIGAKIAALPMNSAGMIYRSLVAGGEPAELMWHKTGPAGYYAALDWTDGETGEVHYVTPPSCEKTTYGDISRAGHGTQVVLCGEKAEDDTCATFSPSQTKSGGNLHWAVRELNFKFWRFPKDISIRVENAKVNGSDSGPKSYIIHGGERGMRDFAENQGVVNLEENPYRVKWFLLNTKTGNSHNGWSEGRTIGTLYRENTGVVEVYAIRRARKGAALMNDFGIYTGAERVVLLVEPTRQELMQPTTARNDLNIADEGTVASAYKEIGEEFASLMAERASPLAAYVKSQLEGLASTSDEKTLREVIARAIELYMIKDYRRLAKGKIRTKDGGQQRQLGSVPRVDEDSNDNVVPPESDLDPPDEPRHRPRAPKPVQRPRPKFEPDPDGSGRADPVPPNIEPKVFTWEKMGTYDVTDYETNAQKQVKINTEGETYLRLLALYKARPDFAGYSELVDVVIRNRCEACLQLSIFTLEQEFVTRRSVLGVDFEKFFSENQGRVCLDAMASREIHNAIVRDIKNEISKAKSKAAAESAEWDKEDAA